MKRKIFTLIAAAAVCVAAVAQDKPTVEVLKTPVAITLDGEIDAIWAGVEANNCDIAVDAATGEITASGFWKACWNDDGIFVLVSVEDDNHFPAYTGSHWEYDKPEIYFDVLETLVDGVGASGGITTGHSQFAPPFVEGGDGVIQAENGGSRKYAHLVTGSNYVMEYFVPFTFLDSAEAPGYKTRDIGFDVTIIDRDAESELGRLRKTWANDGSINESWANMDGCGIITLSEQLIEVSVKSAKVAKASVNITNGMLNGVNGNVSVFDVTGKLVLKAVANGSVNVSALKSGVYMVKADNVSAKVIK